MDYKKYFKRLIDENESKKGLFPKQKIFKHKLKHNYTEHLTIKTFQYSFVVRQKESCLVVELLCEKKSDYFRTGFQQLLEFKDEISNQLEDDNIKLIWQPKEESQKGTRWRILSKFEVDHLDDETKWNEYINWHVNTMIKFLEVLPQYTEKLKKDEEKSMQYVEDVLGQISADDIIKVIREYEDSDFTSDGTKNRYFKFDKSDYILPSKYIVKTALKQNELDHFIEQLTSNYADIILGKIFQDDNFQSIDSNKENAALDLYQEIALQLLNYKQDRLALIDIIKDMQDKDLNTISIKDISKNGEGIELRDIDPFTFYANFNRRITPKKRANLLKYLKDNWELKSKIPTFDPHIPWMLSLSAWFFRYEKERKAGDIELLWKLFAEILSDKITAQTFNRCLEIGKVRNNLSFGLFWLDSDKYISIDSSTKAFIAEHLDWYKEENLDQLKYEGYFRILHDLKLKFPNKSFYEIVAQKIEIPKPTKPIDAQQPKYLKEFEKYLMNTPSSQGPILDNNQIQYMIKDLDINIPIMLQKPNDSLLSIDDINYLKNIKNRMWGGNDLHNVQYAIGNGRPSRALFQYINFHESEIIDPYPPINSINKILYGPPGTGKTYKLQQLQKQYEDGKYTTITFHQSYGYEDFVEGLKAKINDNGDVHYEVENGIFKDICEKAEKDPKNNYAIFIDEINRGNISKIFGELITLIEVSKRGMELQLPYSKEPFSVPENLSIIGTMNTADRSIAVLDTALRRRFVFEEMMPKYSDLKTDIEGINLQKLLKTINERIEFLYDRDHTIGHAYFIDCKSFEELYDLFKNKIIPLLQEYFYDDWKKINIVFNDNGFIKSKPVKTKELFSNCKDFEEIDEDKDIYYLDEDALMAKEEYVKIYKTENLTQGDDA